MPICEKCWADAYRIMLDTGESQYDCYIKLIRQRKDNPCSLEEQTFGVASNDDANKDTDAERKTQ